MNMPKCLSNVRLPSSCCCGRVKVPTASRVFVTLRLTTAILMLLYSLEAMCDFNYENEIELKFDEEFFAEHDELEIKRIQAEHHRQFLIIYYSMLSSSFLLGLIELIMCSLQIHGARKKIVNFILPYAIWTGILMIVLSIIFLIIFSLFVSKPHIIGLVLILIIMGGFLALNMCDFIYALANYKQMRATVGMDHVRLNEI